MFAYVALGGVESYLPRVDNRPSPLWYPIAYAAKVAIVAGLAWWSRATWRDLRPAPSAGRVVLAALIGLLVTALWVGLDGLYPVLPFSGPRSEFDPTALAPMPRAAFIAIRMLGLVVLVPVVEELFWRSFLMRWLIDQEFQRVPIGKVTPLAAVVTSVFFALAHPEWLPALVTGLLWAWLLWHTRSLAACVISHAVANLALGLHVVISGAWKYW
jgi:CAAX prenyl protease-like protein